MIILEIFTLTYIFQVICYKNSMARHSKEYIDIQLLQ